MTGVGRRVTPECTGFAPSKTVISCHTSDNARPVGQRLIDAGPSSLALALNSSMQVSFLIISLSLSLRVSKLVQHVLQYNSASRSSWACSRLLSRNWSSTCCSRTVLLSSFLTNEIYSNSAHYSATFFVADALCPPPPPPSALAAIALGIQLLSCVPSPGPTSYFVTL